jgi:hypothetical protein
MQRPIVKFDAEDHKVYAAWVRRTLIAYGALILVGTAMLAVQATKHTKNVAEFTAGIVTPR